MWGIVGGCGTSDRARLGGRSRSVCRQLFCGLAWGIIVGSYNLKYRSVGEARRKFSVGGPVLAYRNI